VAESKRKEVDSNSEKGIKRSKRNLAEKKYQRKEKNGNDGGRGKDGGIKKVLRATK